MVQKKSKYHYDGPVYYCNNYVGNWSGDTWAISDRKALSNLSFRYKTEHKLVAGTLIKLDADFLSESTAIDSNDDEGVYHQMTIEEWING